MGGRLGINNPKELIMKDRKTLLKEHSARYYNNHSHCPKCGYDSCSRTYMGYIMNADEVDNFKDENKVKCKCGWSGIVNDLR